MKIIGITSGPNKHVKVYLVEITEIELANVAGYAYPSQQDFQHRVSIGATIDVSEAFQRLTRLRDHHTMKSTAETLTRLAGELTRTRETIMEMFDPPAPEKQ